MRVLRGGLRMMVGRILEGGSETWELLVVGGLEGGGRRADGVEELVDGSALVDVRVVERVVHDEENGRREDAEGGAGREEGGRPERGRGTDEKESREGIEDMESSSAGSDTTPPD